MKKNITITCLAAVFAISFAVDAQAQEKSRVGLKGGLAVYSSTASISALGFSEEETSDSRMGFTAGIFVEKPFSDLISLQVEGLYVQKGGKDEVSGEDFGAGVGTGDGDLLLSYLDVPVMLKVNIPLESNVSPFLYGGGFAGYLLDASAEADGQSAEDEGIEIKDLLNDLNYGVVLGAGVTFGALTLDIRYDMDLANIFDKDSDLINDLRQEFGDVEGIDQLDELLDGIEITTSGLMVTAGISF